MASLDNDDTAECLMRALLDQQEDFVNLFISKLEERHRVPIIVRLLALPEYAEYQMMEDRLGTLTGSAPSEVSKLCDEMFEFYKRLLIKASREEVLGR